DLVPLILLLRLRHGVRLGPAVLKALVAEPRPVPSAGDRASATENRPVEVRRVGEVGDPAHAARPRKGRLILIAACRDDLRLCERLDLRLYADGSEILLDRLGDTRIRIGVHRIERGREAILEAGLLHELLCAFDVVRIALVGLVVAGHQRRQHLAGRRRSAVDDAHDAIFVDRHIDRLADAYIVERLLGRVDRDVACLKLLPVDDQVLGVRRVLDLQIFGWRNAVAGDIDFTLLQPQERNLRFLADFNAEAVEIGTVAEIVDIAREDEALTGRPLVKLERAGADRLLTEVSALRLDGFLRHRGSEIESEHIEEGGVRLGQSELDRGVVGRLDARDGRGRAICHLVLTDNGMEEAAGGPLGLRIHGALNRVFDVRRRDVPPAGELGLGTELEGVDQPVRRYGPTVGERGNDLCRAELVVDKAREKAVDHRPALPVITNGEAPRSHVVLIGADDRAALSGRIVSTCESREAPA